MELDLGYKAPDYGSMELASAPPSEPKTKTCYPEFAVPGNIALARSLEAGQELTATVKLRVTQISVRDRADSKEEKFPDLYSGTRVEFEVQSMNINGVKVDESANEEDGKTAFRKYLSKKKGDDEAAEGEEE